MRFQSAPPVKGATLATKTRLGDLDVSIRAPREGGDDLDAADFSKIQVSIRAPREGGDGKWYRWHRSLAAFQSAPPVKGATVVIIASNGIKRVSIRAPREGGDMPFHSPVRTGFSFNPRPP